MLLHEPDAAVRGDRLRLVLFDFGGSKHFADIAEVFPELIASSTAVNSSAVKELDSGRSSKGASRRLGVNADRSDLFMLSCAFAKHLYPDCLSCRDKTPPVHSDETSLKHVLTFIMNEYRNPFTEPDFNMIKRKLAAVVSVA